jgi:two-component system, NtrC family, response regulator AtoC
VGAYAPNQHEILLVDVADGSTAEEVKRRITRNLGERGVRPRVFSAFYPRDGRTAYALTATLSAQSTAPAAPNSAPEIVVADALMRSLYQLVDQIAASSIGVLLLGETGVGKEVFARAIHTASPRAKNAFVDINCAALSESLLESELFGHEKGAFTSAVAAKTGLLESAQGGTVLLDEVGDMPLVTQAKLLRVIEDRSVRRVGGVKARPLDIRFVAATNRDLQADVARGTFRRDLYFRLNGVTIVIPPLRERVAEIEPLARALAAAAAAQASRPVPNIADDALALLRAYPWPGNVRELRNVIERAILVCGDGEIRAEHLPAGTMSTMFMSRRDTPIPDDEPVDEQWLPPRPRTKGPEERQWIVDALERAKGNQTKTARMLGISRRTLITRLEEYGLHRPRKRT